MRACAVGFKYCVVLWLAMVALAEQPQGVFTADVNLATVFVRVTDSLGRPAANLGRESFALYEDGIRQEIRVFERRDGTPLSVALLLDTSMSTVGELSDERTSARELVRGVLDGSTDTSVALYVFDWKVSRRSGFSSDAGRLGWKLRFA